MCFPTNDPRGKLFGDDCDHIGFWPIMAPGIIHDPTVICMVQARAPMYFCGTCNCRSQLCDEILEFTMSLLSSTDCTDQGDQHPLPGKLPTDQKGKLFVCEAETRGNPCLFSRMLVSGASGLWFKVLPACFLHLPPCGGGD